MSSRGPNSSSSASPPPEDEPAATGVRICSVAIATWKGPRPSTGNSFGSRRHLGTRSRQHKKGCFMERGKPSRCSCSFLCESSTLSPERRRQPRPNWTPPRCPSPCPRRTGARRNPPANTRCDMQKYSWLPSCDTAAAASPGLKEAGGNTATKERQDGYRARGGSGRLSSPRARRQADPVTRDCSPFLRLGRQSSQ